MAAVSAMPAINVPRQQSTSPTPSTSVTPNATSEGKCPTGTETATLTPLAIYDILPQKSDISKGLVSGVHLESWDDASQIEQVVVYQGIPADAKTCSFRWRQGDRLDRTFLVKNSTALAGVRKLSGFPADGESVTSNSIKSFDNSETDVGSADFSFWDTFPASTHIVGSVNCSETLYFKIGLRNPKGNSQVWLSQDESNGYFLSYTC